MLLFLFLFIEVANIPYSKALKKKKLEKLKEEN